jgi:hypothetical protein
LQSGVGDTLVPCKVGKDRLWRNLVTFGHALIAGDARACIATSVSM